MNPEVKKQLDILSSGAEEIVPVEELAKKLEKSIQNNKPLRVKIGIDPTSPDVHIGHMVPYRKIRQFQDLGHTGILIIGDYTARIGDPTGRNAERPPLTEEDVKKNAQTYTDQIYKVVNPDKVEVHYQSEWFNDFSLSTIVGLAAKFSVAQMLAHETFRKRLDEGNRLSLHELFYPLLQAFDSVAIKADVELGGTDQKFNILCGRDLMRESGMEPQVALLLPLLMGTNGTKMSKSLGNHIPVMSTPKEKFGKVMSIADDLLINYFLYASNLSTDEIEAIKQQLASGNVNPRDLKLKLARNIITIYHSEAEAMEQEQEFINVFSKKEIPADIKEYKIGGNGIRVTDLLKELNFAPSASEAKRLIKQNAVSLDNEKITDFEFILTCHPGEEKILKSGKRNFVKIVY